MRSIRHSNKRTQTHSYRAVHSCNLELCPVLYIALFHFISRRSYWFWSCTRLNHKIFTSESSVTVFTNVRFHKRRGVRVGRGRRSRLWRDGMGRQKHCWGDIYEWCRSSSLGMPCYSAAQSLGPAESIKLVVLLSQTIEKDNLSSKGQYQLWSHEQSNTAIKWDALKCFSSSFGPMSRHGVLYSVEHAATIFL